MIPASTKLHLSETLLQQIDQYPELAVKNKFTAAASILQRAIRSGDLAFEQEAKVVLFDMLETEFLSYEGEGWELKEYEKYLLGGVCTERKFGKFYKQSVYEIMQD